MPEVKWLVEREVFEEENRLLEAIRHSGNKCFETSYIPFNAGMIECPYSNEDCVVSYGSINLIRKLYRTQEWIPNAWFNLENLACTTYYTHWSQYLFQDDYFFMTWGELKNRKTWIERCFNSEPVFIKPNENLKVFTGKVVEWETFDHFYKQEDECYTPTYDSLVIVSRAKNIDREWRLVIIDGKVITGSLYKEDRKTKLDVNVPKEVINYAEVIAGDKWTPDSVYVMDICQRKENLNLLEIGAFNCAGLYASDLNLLVECINKKAQEDYTEIYTKYGAKLNGL